MRTKVATVPQWVCTDCFVLLVNGEVRPDCENAEDLLTRLEGVEPTPGMLREFHACAEGTEECGCVTNTFSWSACDGCGSPFGGERHAVTGWIFEEAKDAVSKAGARR